MDSPSRIAIDAIKKVYIIHHADVREETSALFNSRELDNANLMTMLVGHILRFDDPEVDAVAVIGSIEHGLEFVRCLYDLPHSHRDLPCESSNHAQYRASPHNRNP
jgi:hypothetical protein